MDLGVDRDQAVVILDDRIGGGEAESVAFRLGGEIGIEDALEAIFRRCRRLRRGWRCGCNRPAGDR